ncbi:MAG TPA: hypothetical protein VFY61_09795 [Pyrinomonadaceae bacterium]|nr:hypothetical protein [Pyrinomonadaceae bacterium]
MERTAELEIAKWRAARQQRAEGGVRLFVMTLATCGIATAVLATWLPLQVSIITVFLFAGPHNWFEFRYFLMRLPVRFGKSRNFFVTAFAGIGILTVTYVSLPFVYQTVVWSNETWLVVLASWNTLLLAWLAVLIRLRAKQKRGVDWSWATPLLLALAALNWLGPEFFSLAIVYAHPLVALWFLDRQLKRTRPEWLAAYRRCLLLLPVILVAMIWSLSQTSPLSDDNGLFWRITQHSGAQLLPQVSSHMLVSVHLFLEMLHYAVWIVALQLLSRKFWNVAKAKAGFPRKVLLGVGLVGVAILWLGFATNYTDTRDLYFTIAIAHVLAEAPFLLKTL